MKFKLTSNIYCTVRSNEIFSTHACCFCPIPLDAYSTIKTGARCTEVEVQTTVYTSKTSSTVTSCHSSISFIACTTVKACVNVTELKINVTTCAIKSFSTNTACCWTIFLHTCPTIITSVQPTVWRVCFTQQSSEASGTITQLSLFLFLQCKCHHSCRLLVCRSWDLLSSLKPSAHILTYMLFCCIYHDHRGLSCSLHVPPFTHFSYSYFATVLSSTQQIKQSTITENSIRVWHTL